MLALQQVLDYHDHCNTGIDKKFQVPALPGFFTNNSLQYHDPDNQGNDPDNQGMGFFLLPGSRTCCTSQLGIPLCSLVQNAKILS